MRTSVNKILPVDVYHTVSMPELILEHAIKICHISNGEGDALPRLEPGTLIVLCNSGCFSCSVNKGEYEVTEGQVMLAASESVTNVKPFSETKFGGVVIYVNGEFLINRQRFFIRSMTAQEKDDAFTYLRLIEKEMATPREIRSKIVEPLLRVLILCLQNEQFLIKREQEDIPPFLWDFTRLINRYHHAPAYFYADKLGISSAELNTKCRLHAQMTAVEWISGYVLLEAKDLLRKTRLRVHQVAELLCFANQDTFSRWFRRQTGEFPSEWNK